MTDKTKAQLRECPFCGSDEAYLRCTDGEWHVSSSCCDRKRPFHNAFVIADTEAEAIEAWNMRHGFGVLEGGRRMTGKTKRQSHGDAEKKPWEHLIEEMDCCPKCGAKGLAYVSTVVTERMFFQFGSSEPYDVDYGKARGGVVFRCSECGKAIFDTEGKLR